MPLQSATSLTLVISQELVRPRIQGPTNTAAGIAGVGTIGHSHPPPYYNHLSLLDRLVIGLDSYTGISVSFNALFTQACNQIVFANPLAAFAAD
jgi:hypothetical protein